MWVPLKFVYEKYSSVVIFSWIIIQQDYYVRSPLQLHQPLTRPISVRCGNSERLKLSSGPSWPSSSPSQSAGLQSRSCFSSTTLVSTWTSHHHFATSQSCSPWVTHAWTPYSTRWWTSHFGRVFVSRCAREGIQSMMAVVRHQFDIRGLWQWKLPWQLRVPKRHL